MSVRRSLEISVEVGVSNTEFILIFFSTAASSLPLGINEHSDPNAIGEEHKKIGIQSK